MKITVVLHNIRSAYNVGAILRTCEGLGVEKVVYSGYTPTYEDTDLLPHLRAKLNRQIEKSALGAERLVRQEKRSEILAFLDECAEMKYGIIGLENNLNADEISRKVVLGEKNDFETDEIVLILGEEVNGIPAEIREKCEYFLEIPMKGQKESFNVSVAAGIGIWGLGNLY